MSLHAQAVASHVVHQPSSEGAHCSSLHALAAGTTPHPARKQLHHPSVPFHAMSQHTQKAAAPHGVPDPCRGSKGAASSRCSFVVLATSVANAASTSLPFADECIPNLPWALLGLLDNLLLASLFPAREVLRDTAGHLGYRQAAEHVLLLSSSSTSVHKEIAGHA